MYLPALALSSIQLTIIQAEFFFSFVIHYVSFALSGIVVKKIKKKFSGLKKLDVQSF